MPAAEAIALTADDAGAAAALVFSFDKMFNGLARFSSVAVAVSGGPDSMALLRLLVQWNGSRLHVLTVDHGLRAESAAEAVQVAAWCAALGVAHHTLQWCGPKPAQGIQAAARQARYDLMAQWCAAHDVGVLATGHTADDQAETVFMRQQRTASAKSLAAIWPVRNWGGVQVARPLLALRRQDLKTYLRSIGQQWLNDPSNDNPRFERVRVRAALRGAAIEPLLQVAAEAQAQAALDESAVRAWLRQHAVVSDLAVIELPRLALQTQPESVRADVLSWVLDRAGGETPSPQPDEVRRLTGWLETAQAGARRTLGGALVQVRAITMAVMREAGRISQQATVVPDCGKLVWDRRFVIDAMPGTQVVPQAKAHGQLRVARRQGVAFAAQAALPALCQAVAGQAEAAGGQGNGWQEAPKTTLYEGFQP